VRLVGLAAVTVAATTWAIMAANWTDGTGVALVTAVVAVVEAALVSGGRTGRLLGASAGLVLGIVVVVLLTLGAMPPDAGRGLGHVALRYTRALSGGLFSADDWEFLVGLCGVMWLIGFWVGWLALRERSGSLAVLPCVATLMVNVLNAPSIAHVALPETVALGLCLLLVARVHLDALERGWRQDRLVALPGTRRRFASAAAGAAALVLVLGVAVPPLTTSDVSGALFGLIPGFGQGSGGSHGPGQATPGVVEYSPAVLPGGPLVSDPRLVLSYTTDSPGAVYLRVVVDSSFQSGNWYPATDIVQLPASNGGPIARDREPDRGGLPQPFLLRRVQARIDLLGQATGRGASEALFPGEPDSLNVPNAARGVDGVSQPACVRSGCSSSDPSAPVLTVDSVKLTNGTPTFTATGFVPIASEVLLRAARTAYPNWVAGRYTRLPVGSADAPQLDRILALARQWTAGASNAYDAAVMIEQRLRAFTYTLTPPAPPQNEWPITFFLERSHAGYCQYFASSMGTMLRALGIPARLVSGYGPGSVDHVNGKQVTYSVTTTDAHTWVEAYFPGYGWVPFEPTPSSSYGAYEPIPRGGAVASPGAVPSPSPAPTPGPAPREKPSPGGSAAFAGRGPSPALLVAALVLLIVVAATSLGWRWMRRPRGPGGVWRRLSLMGRLCGVRQRP